MMSVSTIQYAVIALAVVIVVVAVVRFELLCFNDLAQRSDRELNYLSRAGWAVVIALVIPVGGICYLYYGRSR
jgi:heme/copper-type cytochrome/quinol oxidase subunit 4